MIQKGRSIKIAGDTRPGTVADLFDAYVKNLKDAEKPSWKETEKGLNKIADALGRNRPAREIEPDEIVEVIRPIYERGKKAMADHVRSYIHAAYSWGLKSEHDYRSASQRRFRLVYNPATGIPTEPKKVGTRWLDEDEFVRLYRWLECPDAPVHPPYTRAVRILMLTGQRVEEIARLHVDNWDAESFQWSPIVTSGGRGRHWLVKLACRRKSETVSRTTRCRMLARRVMTGGTTCGRSGPVWRSGTNSFAQCSRGNDPLS